LKSTQLKSTQLKSTQRIALAHDYLTQRGGAERVAAIMGEAFPGAPLYTTLYEPTETFPDFAGLDVRTSAANRSSILRRYHRLAFPVLAPVVNGMTVDADLLLVSSSGWAHGIRCTGRKVVYCHAPARWLYQRERYLGPRDGLRAVQRVRRAAAATAVATLGAPLRSWDRQQALGANRYVVNSTVVQQAVLEAYGLHAEVLPPPPAMLPVGEVEPLDGIERPFLLCVARLLPYKNVAQIIEATKLAGTFDLVVVGQGPDRERLLTITGDDQRIHLLGAVSDSALRWLYSECTALVAASYEDYGLSPLEAASFGKPTVALRAGGFLDTIDEFVNGVFFAEPEPAAIAGAISELSRRCWDVTAISRHAQSFSHNRFVERLRAIVTEELA
jgi:glycosyltransferase involved in cell wall biosynthesis